MKFHSIKFIHQIFIDDSFSLPKELPSNIIENRQSALDIYPESRYHLWCGAELRSFIEEKFDRDVLESFDKLKAYAFKCDLARYCLLSYYGGIYFDLSIRMQNFWKIPLHCSVAAFLEQYENMPLWVNTQQSLLWSLPNQREWELVIKYIVQNCKNDFYGPHDHYVTGPALLGRCMAQAIHEQGIQSDANSQYMGEIRHITPENKNKNSVFIAPDRTLVASRNKVKPGSSKELGINKGNSYPNLWRSRKIYGETTSKWFAGGPIIKITDKARQDDQGLHIEKGNKGRVSFGPYIDIIPGKYKLKILCGSNTNLFLSKLEISSEGNKIINKYIKNIKFNEINIYFYIKKELNDVEFRICSSRFSFGIIKNIELIGPI
ncbi:hypothetical protein D3W54_06740 [Komagataeibacter medellinensis]|uniref:Glycosyltransferase n=1 Tax=Komagataeibacter medellinensis TaxID=1177712 RepID=A0ABQ6VUV2_9PROT|nr:glycosyltransferase [Komagataeibacter medellinensis]KAB8123948.1 hypothetical protein D3W54_06740 [Komagataeibacter medellinensis]